MSGLSPLTSKQKFDRDMVYGEDLEQRLLTAFEWSFPDMVWEKHRNCWGGGHCKCFDLEDLASQLSVECKKDWKAMETGNVCFETYLIDPELCKADYLAHETSPDELYLFKMDTFRKWVTLFGKAIMVGDGKRTEAWVIDKAWFLKNVPHRKIDLSQPLTREIFE